MYSVILICVVCSVLICIAIICYFKRQNHLLYIEAQKQYKRAEFNIAAKKQLELWFKQKQSGKHLNLYFQQHNISRVAIYGMTQIGVILYHELNRIEVETICAIDRSGKTGGLDIASIKPEKLALSDLEGKIDAIIVTPIYEFSSIYDLLYKIVGDQIPVLGLDEILYEI